jgi:hypothetical protein
MDGWMDVVIMRSAALDGCVIHTLPNKFNKKRVIHSQFIVEKRLQLRKEELSAIDVKPPTLQLCVSHEEETHL